MRTSRRQWKIWTKGPVRPLLTVFLFCSASGSPVRYVANRSDFSACSTVTWSVIAMWSAIYAHFAGKALTIRLTWNVTPEPTPAYDHISATSAISRSRSVAHWSRIRSRCTARSISTRTRNAAKRCTSVKNAVIRQTSPKFTTSTWRKTTRIVRHYWSFTISDTLNSRMDPFQSRCCSIQKMRLLRNSTKWYFEKKHWAIIMYPSPWKVVLITTMIPAAIN